MKEFFIVCKWDNYYPSGGIGDIVLVTEDWVEAVEYLREWENQEEGWIDGKFFVKEGDNCVIYSSNNLPWSKK